MNNYKVIHIDITRIVNKFDPAGLIGGGAPDDEYSSEVGSIVSMLIKTANQDDITNKVKEIFTESFEVENINLKSCDDLSKELIKLKESGL